MGQADQQPAWWVRRLVSMAVRVLPRQIRDRYRRTYLAELQGRSRFRQVRHLGEIAVTAVRLRLAIHDDVLVDTHEGHAHRTYLVRRTMRCVVGSHSWVPCRNEFGEQFMECRRCRKFHDPYPLLGPAGRR